MTSYSRIHHLNKYYIVGYQYTLVVKGQPVRICLLDHIGLCHTTAELYFCVRFHACLIEHLDETLPSVTLGSLSMTTTLVAYHSITSMTATVVRRLPSDPQRALLVTY